MSYPAGPPANVQGVLPLCSCGLDTSEMVKWIQDQHRAEVVALTTATVARTRPTAPLPVPSPAKDTIRLSQRHHRIRGKSVPAGTCLRKSVILDAAQTAPVSAISALKSCRP